MASLATACRLSARLTARQLRQDATVRGFRTSAAWLEAQNFTMPALSPTMTEGNIASWKVKEGDSFSAGDVLLEIETDKASMDVEAQDDGVMAKIFQGDGAKGIKVGTRIGVVAESGDDISSLEIPPEDSAPSSSPKEETSKQQTEASPTPKPSNSASADRPAPSASKPAEKQTYPLLPSVQHLVHEKGLLEADVDKMTPTGPNNRLLKGDVLAYLGSISNSYPTELSEKIQKLSHLDLSNIKLAPPAPAAPAPAKAPEPAPEQVVEELEVALSISLASTLEVQQRIQKTLRIHVPLSTFIARAADVANDDLPRPKNYKPSADELFNQVLGIDKAASESGVRGHFFPQVGALPQAVSVVGLSKAPAKSADILDILSGKTRPAPSPSAAAKPVRDISAATNLFSVTVSKDEKKRAQIFLDRIKSVLEGEPGRLIL